MLDKITKLLKSKKISFTVLKPVSEKKECIVCKKDAFWSVDGFNFCTKCSLEISRIKAANIEKNVN
jgi:hypothetical protein